MDTLGEVVVLAIAALGAVALFRAGRVHLRGPGNS
jgi:multisubunit Na+/H+ antiporter MnhB subunit